MKIRKLLPGDIPAAIRLKEIAGWNQVPGDWEAYLQLEPEGCFAAEVDGRLAATTTTINYENRFGWIGMVIVDPDFRRRGIASRMIERAVDYLEAKGCSCQKLDATETGARVYECMGFTVEYEVQRWLRPVGATRRVARSGQLAETAPLGRPAGSPLGWKRSSTEARVIATADLETILQLDRPAFGASRHSLLRWYCANGSPSFWAVKNSGAAGYVVGRPGSGAWQMGPLVARRASKAVDLMSRFLAELESKAIIADVIAENAKALEMLAGAGFEQKRVLYRMYRGANAWPGRPLEIFCLAGFEYG